MTQTSFSAPDSKVIQSYFDAIPKRYDFLNSFLSLSFDRSWRRSLVREALQKQKVNSILDIGAGTGTSLQAFLKANEFKLSAGCDFSQGMLQVAKGKVKNTFLSAADLHHLPFADRSFELITSSFVLRSVKDMNRFLSEVRRV